MMAAGAIAAGSLVWLSIQPLRDELRLRDLEVAALKSRLETYGLSERELSARKDDSQRLTRAVSAMESALQQANQREEALRRRLAAVAGGRQDLMGPPAPPNLRPQPAMRPPEILAAVQDSKARRAVQESSAAGLRPVSPVGTYLREDRPTFTWSPVQDAVSYELVVHTVQGQEIAREIGITEPRRALGRSLPRGKVYRWEIIALGGGREIARIPGPSEPAALFGIFSAKQLEGTVKVEAESRLSRAAGLAKAGLLDEAEAELDAISRPVEHDDVRRRARLLADQIRAWRR